MSNVTGIAIPSLVEIKANRVPRCKKKQTRDLGLDLSISCIGWAFGIDKDLYSWGKFIITGDASSVGAKLALIRDFFMSLLETFAPDRLFIEKPLLGRGNTTRRHLEILGLVRALWFEYKGEEVLPSWVVSPMTVKNALKVKRGHKHSRNKKIMVYAINEMYGLNLRYGSRNKLSSDDDIADAIALLTTVWR